MLFMPSPESLQSDFSAIKAKKDADYQNHQSIWNVFWVHANNLVRLESGDSTLMNNWGNNPATLGSSNYYINRARPIGLSLSGTQRQNRKSTIVVPYENGDQFTSDQWTKLLLNLYKKEDVYELISEAFHQGSIVSGFSMIQVYLDFQNDPLNGDPKFRHLGYSEVMCDPYFKDPSAQDARFIMIRSYLSKPEIAHIMPSKYYDMIMRLSDNPQGSTVDGKFQYQAAARGYSMAPKLAYDEYYYRDYREQTKLYDTFTGAIRDVTDRDDLDLPTILAENPQLRIEKSLVPTVRLCITIQDHVFYDGPNPLGIDCYPFVPFLGYYNKNMPYMYNRFQSPFTSLLSPQILFNRRLILNMDYLESTVNTGWMFKENSLLDPKHLLQTGQGRMIPIKKEFTPLVDVAQIPGPNVPPSAFQQLEVLDKQLFDVLGMSPENFGKVVDDDSSGYLAALRTRAGLVAQQPLFDRLDLSQNMLGNIVMEVIRNNLTPGKIRMMLGGEEPADLFYDRAFGKYHCAVENGYNTETQVQLEFAQKLKLREIGVNISDAQLLASATMQHKDRVIAEVEQSAQAQQQAQQMQQQVQMQELQARTQLHQATARSQIASSHERDSRVEENRALAIEKMHEANAADERATLDKIKALKELESIDLDHLERLVALANSLKVGEQLTSQRDKAEVKAPVQEQVQSPQIQQGADFERGSNLAA